MSNMSNDLQYPKKKRSRTGCITCRTRKVKCDEGRDTCDNCKSLDLECNYNRPERTLRSRRGKRNLRSCNGCRVARCKCLGSTTGRPSCERCRQQKLHCSFEDLPHENPSARPVEVVHQEPDSIDQSLEELSVNEQDHKPLGWLNHQDLPDTKHIKILIEQYFQNIHPIRCFSFIHKPTFMQKLDDKNASAWQGNALLHIMCTLGAQFFALNYSDTVQQLPSTFILKVGSKWASTAERLLLGNTNHISINGLMTAQLLYDYALRMANFTQAFVFSALMARMTQALQLNLEYSPDLLDQSPNTLSATARESRRRLMWSCYVTDVLCSNGVEQLTLIFEKNIKIQLPCNERNFLHERPSITRTLNGSPLEFIPPDQLPADIDNNMGILAYLIQQLEIRRRVLWYIKHLDIAKSPWLPDSEFAHLDRELQTWYSSLPPSLQFTTSNIYIRKESSQLGTLCFFHCAYHQTMLDFYRIGTPEMFKLRSPFNFPPETHGFQRHLQHALFKEARTLAAIIAEAAQHGPRMIGDTWLPTIAYESNRVMLFYLTQVTDPLGINKRNLVLSTIPYLQSNLKALKTMCATNKMAESLYRGAESMLQKLGVNSNIILPLPNVILDDPCLAFPNRESEVEPQRAADSDLHPLSIFRMARKEIPEGHLPVIPVHSRSLDTTDASVLPIMEQAPRMDGTFEEFGHNLDMFFMPDLARDWQVAEMLLESGTDGGGPMSWTGMSQMGGYP